MKRTPLKRYTPLRVSLPPRHGKMRAAIDAFKMSQTKHARRPRGREFMAWTSTRCCSVARASGWRQVLVSRYPELAPFERCDGPIQVDHAGCRFKQGDGTRAFDWTCIPMCRRHHEMRTNYGGQIGQAGIFYRFTKALMRAWCDALITLHHADARRAGVAIPNC